MFGLQQLLPTPCKRPLALLSQTVPPMTCSVWLSFVLTMSELAPLDVQAAVSSLVMR